MADQLVQEQPLIRGKPLGTLRLVELKDELQRRGLPRSGNKTQLIEKLKKDIALRPIIISPLSSIQPVSDEESNDLEENVLSIDESESHASNDDQLPKVIQVDQEYVQQEQNSTEHIEEHNEVEHHVQSADALPSYASIIAQVNGDNQCDLEDVSLDDIEQQSSDTSLASSTFSDQEATSTTCEKPEQSVENLTEALEEPVEITEPKELLPQPTESRKRKWSNPSSFSLFKGISLDSLNILKRRPTVSASVKPIDSVDSSAVPSETNSEVPSESNSVEASDEEPEAPVKKMKLINESSEAAQLQAILTSEGEIQVHNPFFLPKLRGFFSRILNRVF